METYLRWCRREIEKIKGQKEFDETWGNKYTSESPTYSTQIHNHLTETYPALVPPKEEAPKAAGLAPPKPPLPAVLEAGRPNGAAPEEGPFPS